jgi:transglutaminase-like putative cysteine protease
MERYLKETPILNLSHSSIGILVEQRGWLNLPEYERIAQLYDFVQNEIVFGYNQSDELCASQVLADGYGQCNTKATLLMALLRKCNIACRFHGFTIHKQLQKGAITGLFYHLAPTNIIHSWVEIWHENKWINLEGFILDLAYLTSLQNHFPTQNGAFCGYGVATTNLQKPEVEWQGKDTYIQKDGINHDFGVFDAPDDFYQQHGSNLSGIKRFLYVHFVRKWMNRTVHKIRHGKWS